ncbi:MAG: hypothetical protein LBD13_01055 [Spirochaetaceae bacterium]|jgi:hypothetical protein|nr:hypothetical protein [Spirochaetaceae bacterium]
MLAVIIAIAVADGILFFVVIGSCAGMIYHGANKNEGPKKKSFAVFIPSVIVWAALAAVNTALIVTFIYKNKETILDIGTRLPAEIAGKSLALTVQNFEKSWDENRLRQLANLHISPLSLKYEVQDSLKHYTAAFILDNQSPPEVRLYFSDLIDNHYLAVCDSEDFVYPLAIPLGAANAIPFGKNEFSFTVTVNETVEITSARFIQKKIFFN